MLCLNIHPGDEILIEIPGGPPIRLMVGNKPADQTTRGGIRRKLVIDAPKQYSVTHKRANWRQPPTAPAAPAAPPRENPR